MKIKRFAIERLPFEVECNRPILGRIYLIANFFRFVKVGKINICMFEKQIWEPIYRLYIPKIDFKKV